MAYHVHHFMNYTSIYLIVISIPVYSVKGLRDLYERFMTSLNFSTWIQEKSESATIQWKLNYFSLLAGNDVVDLVFKRAQDNGFIDASVINIFGRFVKEIVLLLRVKYTLFYNQGRFKGLIY